jgi:hypothetical protein
MSLVPLFAQPYSTVQVCDASKDDSSNTAELQIFFCIQSLFIVRWLKPNGNELIAPFFQIIKQRLFH